MPYCFSCGKLRDTMNGMCLQCRSDESLRKSKARRKCAQRQSLDMKPRKENDNGKSKDC